MIDLTPKQVELLRGNGQSTKLYPDKNFYDWQCAWDFLWSALYNGWLDDDAEGAQAAENLLQAMAQARADDSARERGLEAGRAVLIAPLQEQLLVSLHLRAVIYTGMPEDEWNEIREGLLEAQRAVDHDYLYEDTYSYIQLCFDIVEAMDEAKHRVEGGEVGRIIDELMEYKRELGFAILTKYDPLTLCPGEPDGEDIDAYIWEGEVIGTCVCKCDSVDRAATVIAHVLTRSFQVEFEPWEVTMMARELLDRMPDDLVEPDDFPSFEHDIMPIIDRFFSFYESRIQWALDFGRKKAIEERKDPDYYDYLGTVHFLTTFMSDYGVKKQNTGETRHPRVDVWS